MNYCECEHVTSEYYNGEKWVCSFCKKEVKIVKEYLTKDEINMCKYAIAEYQDDGSMSEENEKRWDALWDKLDNMLRSAK